MNAALPLPLQQALRAVIPTPTDAERIVALQSEVRRLRAELQNVRENYQSLLRLPFQFDALVRPAVTHLAPENCSEAEYATRFASDSVVHEAADWLIDKYMPELEAKVSELQESADLEDVA